MDTKTTEQWIEDIPKEFNLKIIHPNGWNREKLEYSWRYEKITKDEFLNRVCNSTCEFKATLFDSEWAKN